MNISGGISGETSGKIFQRRVTNGKILPLVGIYDAFSAKLVAQRFEGVFCSGFGFSASNYGLPDVGYVGWREISDFALRVRPLLPHHHLLVDIDDGFGDPTICKTVVERMESIGVSAVMFEDQKRPRRCGHYEGKEILPVEAYLEKLHAVLEVKKDLFVIARTDATDPEEAIERARIYFENGADGVMVEAIRNLETLQRLSHLVKCPIMINQLHGGKSPNWNLNELQDAGASIVIYSTPCLFAAQHSIENYLDKLKESGSLPETGTSTITECNKVLFGKIEKAGVSITQKKSVQYPSTRPSLPL